MLRHAIISYAYSSSVEFFSTGRVRHRVSGQLHRFCRPRVFLTQNYHVHGGVALSMSVRLSVCLSHS